MNRTEKEQSTDRSVLMEDRNDVLVSEEGEFWNPLEIRSRKRGNRDWDKRLAEIRDREECMEATRNWCQSSGRRHAAWFQCWQHVTPIRRRIRWANVSTVDDGNNVVSHSVPAIEATGSQMKDCGLRFKHTPQEPVSVCLSMRVLMDSTRKSNLNWQEVLLSFSDRRMECVVAHLEQATAWNFS